MERKPVLEGHFNRREMKTLGDHILRPPVLVGDLFCSPRLAGIEQVVAYGEELALTSNSTLHPLSGLPGYADCGEGSPVRCVPW
jgi:hypothetical protein